MNTIPDNTDDVIDSRDVIARIEELQDERQSLQDEYDDAEDDGKAERITLAEWDRDNGSELAALLALQDEAEDYSDDWQHGATLIRDTYFEDYARELAEDLHGDAIRQASWPLLCIDWEKAARELQQDYTSVDFDGVTYWVRS